MVRAVGPRARPPLVPLLAGGRGDGRCSPGAGRRGADLGLLVTVLAAMVWRLADGRAGYQRDVTAGPLIAVYVPFLGRFRGAARPPATDGTCGCW